MADSHEGKLKKALEKAEHEAEAVGRGIKKGTTDVERVIKRGFTRKVKKEEKQ